MKKSHEMNFAERRASAEEARKALLERFKTKPDPNDPAVIARQEERRRIQEAREQRAAEKEAIAEAKRVEEARLKAEAERIKAEKAAAEEAARLAREEAARRAREEAIAAQEAKRKNSQADVIARMLAEDAERMAGWKVKARGNR